MALIGQPSRCTVSGELEERRAIYALSNAKLATRWMREALQPFTSW